MPREAAGRNQRRRPCSPEWRRTELALHTSFDSLLQPYGEPFDRPILCVEKPRTKVRGSAAIDDGGAHDVQPFLEREAFGDAVVDHGLPVAVDADDLLTSSP